MMYDLASKNLSCSRRTLVFNSYWNVIKILGLWQDSKCLVVVVELSIVRDFPDGCCDIKERKEGEEVCASDWKCTLALSWHSAFAQFSHIHWRLSTPMDLTLLSFFLL